MDGTKAGGQHVQELHHVKSYAEAVRESVIGTVPQHVAVVMDGNFRYAQHAARRSGGEEGHRTSVAAVHNTIQAALGLRLPMLSMWAFSVENSKRSDEEYLYIQQLVTELLVSQQSNFVSQGIKVQFVGIRELFRVRHNMRRIEEVERATRSGKNLTLNLLFHYGGIEEVADFVRRGGGETATIANFERHLLPQIDLVIRTGGYQRLSNFACWQIPSSELYFTRTLWPAFSGEEFCDAWKQHCCRINSLPRPENHPMANPLVTLKNVRVDSQQVDHDLNMRRTEHDENFPRVATVVDESCTRESVELVLRSASDCGIRVITVYHYTALPHAIVIPRGLEVNFSVVTPESRGTAQLLSTCRGIGIAAELSSAAAYIRCHAVPPERFDLVLYTGVDHMSLNNVSLVPFEYAEILYSSTPVSQFDGTSFPMAVAWFLDQKRNFGGRVYDEGVRGDDVDWVYSCDDRFCWNNRHEFVPIETHAFLHHDKVYLVGRAWNSVVNDWVCGRVVLDRNETMSFSSEQVGPCELFQVLARKGSHPRPEFRPFLELDSSGFRDMFNNFRPPHAYRCCPGRGLFLVRMQCEKNQGEVTSALIHVGPLSDKEITPGNDEFVFRPGNVESQLHLHQFYSSLKECCIPYSQLKSSTNPQALLQRNSVSRVELALLVQP